MMCGVSTTAGAGTPVSIDDIEALRVPLTRYCYRLLGCAADTDDAVQETLIRAVANVERFDPARAGLTTWVHRIATNVCIDMLRGSSRRALAMDFGPAAEGGSEDEIGAPLPPDRFVEPMPDARLFGTPDPGDLVVERETVKLAWVAALQRLAPRQRAVLVLRDILTFTAAECAELLDTSVPAVNSALQRARARLSIARPVQTDLVDLDDPAQQDLLRNYVEAFVSHDVARLTELLREDAVTSMPPFAWWLRGGARIAGLMAASDACAHDRLLPIAINSSPGFGQYRPDEDGVLRPFALVLLEVRDQRVAQTMTFLGSAERFAEFGLPEHPGNS